MPLPKVTRYRMKKTKKGMVRLAFAKGSNKVIEAKNMKTGETSEVKEGKKEIKAHWKRRKAQGL